ncbi:isopeptide-forming domain-containing fimbrial protein [Acinetobacter soli]|uniref:Isopeptide-forming domain-containing fimbrial protein n=1 Tax=Acinetobacter soli TaxID=487316 RepID=A0AB38YZJ8_9GAMM|nr:isopeptide-forming domain-containing fimbrial protein [Acinetobacter soli]MDQ8942837.1 isopeptide-forming domain-containing fimbrial protein [Acinetobacter soli]WND06858.1 isopeptide-forming domain-containing fimbrial protein [Acinetobacter soli]
MKMINTLNNNRPKLFNWVLTLLCVLMVQQSAWAATNSIISNMAVGEYSEEGSTVVQVARSNLVQTTILPVYSLNLVAANNKTVVAGQAVYFNHILTNTSNETDQYTFTVSNNPTGDDFDFVNSSLMVYLDANNDGIPDGSAITGYTLGAGQSVGLIVAASIPNTITTGKVANLTLMVTSANGASGTNSNVDKATVTDQSTLVVRKKFSQITAANDDVVTIRLDYQNPTNTIVPTATLTDTLGSNLTYEVNTGKWNGVTVYDAVGGTADPTGINYSVTSNVVTATLTNIPANTIGYIEFNVKINKSIAGKIENVINVTGPTTDTSNTAVVNVAPVYAVKMNGSASNVSDNTNTITASAVPQGGELKFTNYVWNIGNTTDRFNLTLTNSTFPAGSQIELYRADGVTPLLDSNGDGIPDTGLLAANTNIPVVVKVRFPSSYTVTTNTVFEVTPQAQSVGDGGKTSTIKDQGTLTPVSQLVDLTNADNTGLGNGAVDNSGAAWKTITVKSSDNAVTGGQVIFPLTVKHTGVGTEYLLSANASSDFSSLTLPAGVNRVRFYASTNGTNCSGLGNEIGKTIYLNNAETQLVCAVVEVDKVNKDVTVPIYFRVISTSFVGKDNPAQDMIKNAVTIQSVNSVPQLEFTPDLHAQVAPLGTVVYRHLLTNPAATDFTGSYGFIINNSESSFNSVLFLDVDGDGKFSSGDLNIRTLADLPGGKVLAHGQIQLLLQVTNVVNNNVNQANTTVVNLTDSSNQVIASIKDVTTVKQSQLTLTKLQARDLDCDGTADETYTTNTLTIGKQSNGQGQCVLYKVILNNSGATTMSTAFTFRDMTPAYTVLSQSPICTSCSSMTAPTVGNAGAVSGTLNSVAANQSYEFNFGVRYVGQ